MTATQARSPHVIRMHAADNVAIVANDGGLEAGTVLTAA
jgi:galactarate dehydratase